jgi:hypothetical protein
LLEIRGNVELLLFQRRIGLGERIGLATQLAQFALELIDTLRHLDERLPLHDLFKLAESLLKALKTSLGGLRHRRRNERQRKAQHDATHDHSGVYTSSTRRLRE